MNRINFSSPIRKVQLLNVFYLQYFIFIRIKANFILGDKMPTDNEEMEVEDLEEGEILSDSDDAIPELKVTRTIENQDVVSIFREEFHRRI